MNPKIIKKRKGPESIIQDAVIEMLERKKWLVKATHGSMYQHSFPDLFACHLSYGARWIEIKNPLHFVFTPGQLNFFPQLVANGVGVWILIAATETEYKKLFRPCNWYMYLM